MFRDLRTEEPGATHDFDICVVGAGAAGITIAREFLNTRYTVAILESGGFDQEEATQSLYRGENAGVPYFDLDICRLRFFGGTTNHWAGYCRPFAAEDFERRAWLPGTGWPITRAEVEPFYRRAYDFLGIDPMLWDIDTISRMTGTAPVEPDPEVLTTRTNVINPARLGPLMRDEIAAAENVVVFLHANVTGIVTNEAATHVEGLRARPIEAGETVFRARQYVLATGGLENARLLLNATEVQREGLGNGRGLVGRYFSDHTWLPVGRMAATGQGAAFEFYARKDIAPGQEFIGYHAMTPEAQEAHGLGHAHVKVEKKRRHVDHLAAGPSLKRVLRGRGGDEGLAHHVGQVIANFDELAEYGAQRLWLGEKPVDHLSVSVSFEPVPNPDSRVTLANETDPLGLRRLRLDWNFTDTDRRTVRWLADRFAHAVGQAGLGRVQLDEIEADFDYLVEGVNHAIGTTRMADTPARGVVDADCTVHGTDNLHIAGSSVFATCGSGSPTMFIIALAMRLSDHLKEMSA